ncbi:MAG: Sec-independent protein translocase protein TatB [Thermodesulfobacteriota bacterium]
MFGIGMPELLVIGVIALLVVGPKKLPEMAKALGKGLSEFRKVTESATDTIKETLKADELKKDLDGLKDSLLDGQEEKEKEGEPVPPAAAMPPEGSTTRAGDTPSGVYDTSKTDHTKPEKDVAAKTEEPKPKA